MANEFQGTLKSTYLAPMTSKARQLAAVRGHVNTGTKTRKKQNKYDVLVGFRVIKGAGRGR